MNVNMNTANELYLGKKNSVAADGGGLAGRGE